jgi:hypothetical protein
MSRLDDDMIDPEFADLAVLVYAERPEPDPDFVRDLDARVERRFEPVPGGTGHRRLRFTWKAGFGSLAAGCAAAVLVVVITSNRESTPTVLRSPTVTEVAPSAGAGGTGTASTPSPERAPATAAPGSGSSASGAPSGASSAGSFGSAAGSAAAPAPPNNGRKIVQSAQLALTAAPNRVEDVAQQVFDVVGREKGVVRRSSVTQTGGLDGTAEFELSVPSGSLAETMTALSRLHGANVASRTDSTADVNDRYVSLTRRLADARALRTGLLRQLAQATTQTEIDSLRARIRDAEASIASLEAQLRSLNRAVSMSQVTVTINAAATPAAHGGGSSFTLGKAAHDAGRVLTVAAGVALIALAVLVPLALVGALIWWAGSSVRHRRRERALDLA